MLVNFCPSCGQKAEQVFNFCPHCGVKLPKEEFLVTAETTATSNTSLSFGKEQEDEHEHTVRKGRRNSKSPVTSPQKQTSSTPIKDAIPSSGTSPALQTIAKDPQQEDSQIFGPGRRKRLVPSGSPQKKITPIKLNSPSFVTSLADQIIPEDPRQEGSLTLDHGRRKRKFQRSSPQKKTTPIRQEPCSVTSPTDRTIAKGGSSPQRRGKNMSVEPLPDNEILTDHSSNKWKLVTLLSHGSCGLLYAAESASGASTGNPRYSLKLDAKTGRIYNEQNFMQRAAKKLTVDKWKKARMMTFLGIPNCIGFGQHADSYRFLVFPDLGRSLQSVLEANAGTLSEKAVFQISYRMLDVLEYVHENEYVHGDLKAEDIFVNPADLREVYLASYYFVYRYCPGGKHVAYREGSRTPHEGTVEFISTDIHKGAGPSRRSDLETLGYCMLKWLCGSLPWSKERTSTHDVMSQKESYKADVAGLLKQCYGKKKHPDALKTYLDHVMCLNYEEKPDYEALRRIFAAPLDKIKVSAYDQVDLKVSS